MNQRDRRKKVRVSSKAVQGIVNVAAIDCDAASNKQLCGEYGVQGFPTIKASYPHLASYQTLPFVSCYLAKLETCC